jgi:hypothetical protein
VRRNQLIAVTGVLTLAACATGRKKTDDNPGSGLTDIAVDIGSDIANVDKLTGYELALEPTGCNAGVTGTKIAATTKRMSSRITEKIKKGCDYDLTLRLGAISSDGSRLDPVYLTTGDRPSLVAKAKLEGANPTIRVDLTATPAGVAAGITARGATGDSVDLAIKVGIKGTDTPSAEEDRILAELAGLWRLDSGGRSIEISGRSYTERSDLNGTSYFNVTRAERRSNDLIGLSLKEQSSAGERRCLYKVETQGSRKFFNSRCVTGTTYPEPFTTGETYTHD